MDGSFVYYVTNWLFLDVLKCRAVIIQLVEPMFSKSGISNFQWLPLNLLLPPPNRCAESTTMLRGGRARDFVQFSFEFPFTSALSCHQS